MSPITRRLGALVAASALTVSGLSLGAAPAQAAAANRSQEQAATWLVGQLTDGLMYNPAFGGFNDYGLSIDTALALKAVGGHDATVTAIGKAIREHFYSYTTGDDFGGDEVYAGGTAKALVLAQVAGTGPSFYTISAQNQLTENIPSVGALAGRIQNTGEEDFQTGDPIDSANVFGQAFAARALNVGGSSDLKDEVLAFLLAQQCADGGFREKFDAKDDPSQGCDVADTATYGDRIGATATAIINLAAIPGDPAATQIATARAWLKTQDNVDGSFGDNGGNANSTGLAAQALGASPEATAAATWLRDHQADDTDACTKLRGDTGAVAFGTTSLGNGRADGIVTNSVGEWQRATSQSVVALQYLPASAPQTLTIGGPAGFRKAGTAALYAVSGAAANSKLCVTVGNNFRAGLANASGNASIAPTLPGGTATRTVTVVDRDGNTDTTTTKVLGATKLGVAPVAKTVKRGGTLKVVVSGLVAGEKVTVKVRTFTVTGTANSLGRFVAFVKPGRTLGKATVTATGQFADIRRGTAAITVVR